MRRPRSLVPRYPVFLILFQHVPSAIVHCSVSFKDCQVTMRRFLLPGFLFVSIPVFCVCSRYVLDSRLFLFVLRISISSILSMSESVSKSRPRFCLSICYSSHSRQADASYPQFRGLLAVSHLRISNHAPCPAAVEDQRAVSQLSRRRST